MGFQTARLSRFSKLRAMSPGEIATRVAYKGTLAIERRRHARGSLVRVDNLRRSLLAGQGEDWARTLLRSRLVPSTRFFPSVLCRDAMRALFSGRYRAEGQDCVRQAALARSHRFSFFGRVFDFPGEIPWQRDPVTGKEWPHSFHADVPVHGGDVGFGDVKYVWELSRQQYLIDLAKANFLYDDAQSLLSMRALVHSWILGNPYATGVNWACALEPAFRAWSWLWAYQLTARSLDDEFHLEWLNGFQLHGRFLFRHLEHYTSPFNHLIGEASALYALGLCFPEFSEAAAWKQRGREVLEHRLEEQFYEDGGTREQSTFYHHATLGFYLLAALLARNNGEDLSRHVWTAIERGLEFSLRLMMPDGRTPEIGGADDGKPIRLQHLPLWDFRPYLAIGAVALRRSDFKALAARFHEDALWLLGPAALETFDSMDTRPPVDVVAIQRSSGYFVARSDWSDKADYVCFDAGEQAGGMRPDAIPNSMHGHADCLSVVVALGGRRVLADSGLYAYNCGGVWEAHFRETAAHNTARIDGRDQARHLGKMAWSHSYRATFEDARQTPGSAWALASHDGYARGPEGVVHRRGVWLRRDRYVILWDEFVGAGTHDLELNFQFAPDTLEFAVAGSGRFANAVDIAWASNVEWSAEIACGGDGPGDGWICPSLGIRQAAPRLRLNARVSQRRTVFAMVLAANDATTSRLTRTAGRRLIRIQSGSEADWLTIGEADETPALYRAASDGSIVESDTLGSRPAVMDAATIAALESEQHRFVGP